MWNSATTRTFQYNQNIIKLENPFQLCSSNNWSPSTAVVKIGIVLNLKSANWRSKRPSNWSQMGNLSHRCYLWQEELAGPIFYDVAAAAQQRAIFTALSQSNWHGPAKYFRRLSLLSQSLGKWKSYHNQIYRFFSFKPKKGWCKVTTWR